MEIKSQRPTILLGQTTKYSTGCGNMYVTVNYTIEKDLDRKLYEVFVYNKNFGCEAAVSGVARLVSALLSKYNDVDIVIDQLKSIRCPMASANPMKTSCTTAIVQALENSMQTIKKDDLWKTK